MIGRLAVFFRLLNDTCPKVIGSQTFARFKQVRVRVRINDGIKRESLRAVEIDLKLF